MQNFLVVQDDRPALLGLLGSEELGDVSRGDGQVHRVQHSEQIIAEFKDLFTGIGLLPGQDYINLKQDATPQIFSAQRLKFFIV